MILQFLDFVVLLRGRVVLLVEFRKAFPEYFFASTGLLPLLHQVALLCDVEIPDNIVCFKEGVVVPRHQNLDVLLVSRAERVPVAFLLLAILVFNAFLQHRLLATALFLAFGAVLADRLLGLLGAVIFSAAEQAFGLHLELVDDFVSLPWPAKHELLLVALELLVGVVLKPVLVIALLLPMGV